MTSLENFIEKFDDFSSWAPTKQIDYIVYHLTNDSTVGVNGNDLIDSFRQLNLKEYKRTKPYLSENASKKNGRYIKVSSGGYRLTRSIFNEIKKIVDQEPVKVTVSSQLIDLVTQVSDPAEKDFLEEAINCYRVKAYRAFVTMVWITTMDHLQRFVFSHYLAEFNVALLKNPDKKVKKIINYDDFSDLTENKIIELLRSAKIISNDVRKILDEKLGTRNSAAHPSGVKISDHKATEFALDLISNVLIKYN